MKENGENHTIDWLIAMKTHPYICGTKKCDSCLCEKLMIARASSASLLNKLDGVVSKCRHMNNTEVFQDRQIECYSHNTVCKYMFVSFYV